MTTTTTMPTTITQKYEPFSSANALAKLTNMSSTLQIQLTQPIFYSSTWTQLFCIYMTQNKSTAISISHVIARYMSETNIPTKLAYISDI